MSEEQGGPGAAEMALMCGASFCGNEIYLPLLLGPGNDFTVADFHGWYLTYLKDDQPFVRCPQHDQALHEELFRSASRSIHLQENP